MHGGLIYAYNLHIAGIAETHNFEFDINICRRSIDGVSQNLLLVSKNTPNNGTISNSTRLPVSIVVGILSPNGTQVSGYGKLSKANHTRVDGIQYST